MKSKPVAVVISDVHFSLNTKELADASMRAAADKASELKVPLLVTGDLHDTKALLRAECVNAMIDTMKYSASKGVFVFILTGNHDLTHEKGDTHALHFLKAYAAVIDKPSTRVGFNFIPYQSNPDNFYEAISKFPKGSTVFAHQGTLGGNMGHYFKDECAVDPEKIKDWRVYFGHYHSHYELLNTVSIGNPYTLNYGEANDGPKGFLVVYEDGSFAREILPLRKHIVTELAWNETSQVPAYNQGDLLWLKVTGPYTELKKLKKEDFGFKDFKLDLIPTDTPALEQKIDKMTDDQVLDAVIDSTSESDSEKVALKSLWREVVNAD